MTEVERRADLKEILNKEQIHHILEQYIGKDVPWKLDASEIKPAMEGLAGFLGEHMRATLHVNVNDEMKKVHLFLKLVPTSNKDKAKVIKEQLVFQKEKLMFKLLEEICRDGANPWYVKAYIYTDSMIVMPDLKVEGYKSPHYLHTLDEEHVFIATTTIARFHAAFVNYETKKSIELKRSYNTFEEFGEILIELMNQPNWLKTCAKLSANLLTTFSLKSYRNLPDLEMKLYNLFTEARDTLREYKNTLNVLLHRDLWVNNIMFKYENDAPVNAVLVDYQLIRYGPPAFDLMIFLYLTTDRSFREEREKDVLKHYYSVFFNNLTEDSCIRLKGLDYDEKDFIKWCEKARMFAIVVATIVFPFVLMDPKSAQETFDNPETFDDYSYNDRSRPVLAYADKNELYKERSLAVVEEFVERYV